MLFASNTLASNQQSSQQQSSGCISAHTTVHILYYNICVCTCSALLKKDSVKHVNIARLPNTHVCKHARTRRHTSSTDAYRSQSVRIGRCQNRHLVHASDADLEAGRRCRYHSRSYGAPCMSHATKWSTASHWKTCRGGLPWWCCSAYPAAACKQQ